MQAILGRFRLALVEDIGAEEYWERYLWPAGRNLAVTRAERCMLARVT